MSHDSWRWKQNMLFLCYLSSFTAVIGFRFYRSQCHTLLIEHCQIEREIFPVWIKNFGVHLRFFKLIIFIALIFRHIFNVRTWNCVEKEKICLMQLWCRFSGRLWQGIINIRASSLLICLRFDAESIHFVCVDNSFAPKWFTQKWSCEELTD